MLTRFHTSAILLLCAMLMTLLSACGTVSALQSTTITQSVSAMDIVDKMILDNLAQAYAEENSLPWHVQVTQGSSSISDTLTPNAGFTWAPSSRTIGLSGSRAWSVSWTIVPELDFQKLVNLRDLYHDATHPQKDFFTIGKPVAGALFGQYKDTTVYVTSTQSKAFGEFVIQVLTKAPVDASQRAVLLPGIQH